MILILGSVEIKEYQLDEALWVSQAHVLRSRQEPGCLEHGVHVSYEAPNRLVFVERWQDMESLKAHFKVPASAGFVQSISALATSPPAMTVYQGTEVPLGGKPAA